MEILSENVILALIPVVAGGVGWYANYLAKKAEKREKNKEEQQRLYFAERDKDKEKIKSDISELKTQVVELKSHLHKVGSMIVKCKHEDCDAKKEYAEYYEKNIY